MKVLAIARLIIYVTMVVIGIAIGYAMGASTAPSPKALTITMPGATSTVTVREAAAKTLTITASPAPLGIRGEILLGALLPITGELSVLGTRSRVAVEIAIYDLNSYVKTLGLPITFKLLVEDSATDPTTALNKLQSLYARGVRAVVGPMASAEVRNVKSYADGNKIVMCSPSSTAPDLAVPDYIFRDIPNDRYQGRAIARLMYDYGIRYVYILYRNDAWGKGLADATEARFKEIGGTVLASVG